MIHNNHPQQIIRFAQKDRAATCLGVTDGGFTAISDSLRARSNVFLNKAKNLLERSNLILECSASVYAMRRNCWGDFGQSL